MCIRGPAVAPAHRPAGAAGSATGAGVGAGVGAAPRIACTGAETFAARCRLHVTTAAAPAKREAFGPKMTVAVTHARIFARRDRGASFDHDPTRRSGRPSSTSSVVQSSCFTGESKTSSIVVAYPKSISSRSALAGERLERRINYLALGMICSLEAGFDSRPSDWICRVGVALILVQARGLGVKADGIGDVQDQAWIDARDA